jgi:hypothetical protein
MRELLPFERQMLLAEVYHYAWYNEDAYKDLLLFTEKYQNLVEKPVFFNPIYNNDTTTTNPESLAYGQDINTNPSADEVQQS